LGADLCPDEPGGQPRTVVFCPATVHVFGDFDLGSAGLRAGDVGDGDLGVPDGQQGGIDPV
jgi:hypothetical protein